MAFTGGPLSTIGITPEFLSGLGTQTASSGVQQAIGQVWKGSGQSFFGSAGQSLGGALAGSAVNIALNSVFSTSVPGPSGFNLSSGANILASTITPFVTGSVAAGINQQIQKSLVNAGPFGSALSTLGTGLVNQAFGGIANSIFGAATPGGGTNIKMFPGGGDEPPADYGGIAYTLTDVVFSLKPANVGPQAEGDAQSLSFPKSITTLPFNELSQMPPLVPNATANAVKNAAMSNAVGTKAFSPNFGNNFSTSFGLPR